MSHPQHKSRFRVYDFAWEDGKGWEYGGIPVGSSSPANRALRRPWQDPARVAAITVVASTKERPGCRGERKAEGGRKERGIRTRGLACWARKQWDCFFCLFLLYKKLAQMRGMYVFLLKSQSKNYIINFLSRIDIKKHIQNIINNHFHIKIINNKPNSFHNYIP